MIRGYVTSRSFAGLSIPVPAQNSCLREYARSLQLPYCLPPLEHKFDNCYMQLFTVINSAVCNDTIAMYSIAMMPLNDINKLNQIRALALKKGISWAFILESKRTSDLFTLTAIMQSYSLRSILDKHRSEPSIETIRRTIDKQLRSLLTGHSLGVDNGRKKC